MAVLLFFKISSVTFAALWTVFLLSTCEAKVPQKRTQYGAMSSEDFLTKNVEELSTNELNGFPSMGWKPLDPFQMQYGGAGGFYIPNAGDGYDFDIMGTMTGSSIFEASGITVNKLPFKTLVNFNATTGPIIIHGRYIVSHSLEGIPLYQGTFLLWVDSAIRTEEIDVTAWSDGSYWIDILQSTLEYTWLNNHELQISGLPEHLTELVESLSPAKILSQLSRGYFAQELQLFQTMIRHPEAVKSDKSVQRIRNGIQGIPNGIQGISNRFQGYPIKYQGIPSNPGAPKKSFEIIEDAKEFFTKKVLELSSTELEGFPIAGWNPIDPSEFLYDGSYNFIVHGPVEPDFVFFDLMGSISGSSRFIPTNIQVTEYQRHYVTVTFNATTGPIRLTARFMAYGRFNGSTTPIYEGRFELTADSVRREERFEIRVAPDGLYYDFDYSSSYNSVTNFYLNITNLPADLAILVKSTQPLDILNAFSINYLYQHMYLFMDTIRYSL